MGAALALRGDGREQDKMGTLISGQRRLLGGLARVGFGVTRTAGALGRDGLAGFAGDVYYEKHPCIRV